VLLDTQGPEIRTGKLKDDVTGKGTVNFVKGNEVLLRTDHATRDAGSTAAVLYINYKDLARSIEIGSKVLLDDGAIALNVNAIDLTEGTVTCTVDNSGELRSRAGVNLPGGIITLPAMSVKDKEDIRYGLKADVDYIAPSFVRNAAGVHEIRSFIKSSLEEMGLSDRIPPMIISKIENTEALVNFDEILEASDGIMVARGDLGVEIPLQHVTNAQKAMVSACNAAGKPVIVATQMLETMTKNPRPTRAEVADVTNAVADGADCVMLSGETAKGSYAPQAVKTMGDIIKSTEDFIRSLPRVARPLPHSIGHDPKETVAMAAVAAAEQSGAKAIIVITKSGTTARLVAKYQPSMPILCFCPNYKIGRQLMITRGCHPYIGLRDFKRRERPAAAVAEAKAMNFLAPGDKYVMVTVQENVEEMGDFTTMHLGTAR
jgi:pyruvate kinase